VAHSFFSQQISLAWFVRKSEITCAIANSTWTIRPLISPLTLIQKGGGSQTSPFRVRFVDLTSVTH
jgi:hypothetical protein